MPYRAVVATRADTGALYSGSARRRDLRASLTEPRNDNITDAARSDRDDELLNLAATSRVAPRIIAGIAIVKKSQSNTAQSNTIRVVQMGCGPIGCNIARLAAAKRTVEVVGAIDITHAGKDLGKITESPDLAGIVIAADARETLEKARPDILLHATGSSLASVIGQLEVALDCGVNVVSTCEELSFSRFHAPELSDHLDALAIEADATILATGVNPGFLMDAWPIFMTGVCQDVELVVGVRVQNAAHRRLPFQQKIGAGLSVEEFRAQVDAGKIRHVGLPESAAMIAASLDWHLDDIVETIEPILATREASSHALIVAEGHAAGVNQVVSGIISGRETIRLEFRAYIGAEESYDAVYIHGTPELEVVVAGGVNGDVATAAVVVNSVPRVLEAPAGLKTMMDIPLLRAFCT